MAIDNRWDTDYPSGQNIGKRIGLDEEAILGADAIANLTIDAPADNPRRLQLEADLWQACIRQCGEWQLKVLPQVSAYECTTITNILQQVWSVPATMDDFIYKISNLALLQPRLGPGSCASGEHGL